MNELLELALGITTLIMIIMGITVIFMINLNIYYDAMESRERCKELSTNNQRLEDTYRKG